MTDASRIDPQTSRFLDSIRGISAILVMLSHVVQMYILPHMANSGFFDGLWEILASYSVMAFFVISGFVITISILENIERNGGKFKPWEFLESRLVRLYPALLFAMLLTIGVYALIHATHFPASDNFYLPGDLFVFREKAVLDWKSILVSTFFLQGIFVESTGPSMNGALWSLSFEFWFYILAMFFTLWIVNKKQFWGGFFTVAILVAVLYLDRNSFFTFLSTWLAGSAWAIIYRKRRAGEDILRPYLWPLIGGLLAAIIVLVNANGLWALIHPYRATPSLIVQTMICWLAMLMTAQIAHWLEKGTFTYFHADRLAPFSYTLYLIHFPLLALAFSFLHPFLHTVSWGYGALVGLVLGAVVLFISSLLARVVENKTMFRKLVAMLISQQK
jgi:peptidoglycan/LPS O-acetylase OafA/YrhL